MVKKWKCLCIWYLKLKLQNNIHKDSKGKLDNLSGFFYTLHQQILNDEKTNTLPNSLPNLKLF